MTSEPLTITFEGRSTASGSLCFLQLKLLDRPYQDATEPWDREGNRAEIVVKADHFKGTYETTVWSHELLVMRAVFTAMHDRLGQPAQGFVDLIEDAFDMKLILRETGHLDIELVARANPGLGPWLGFSMEADQSYLPLWIGQLDMALSRFPAEVEVNLKNPLSYRGAEPEGWKNTL